MTNGSTVRAWAAAILLAFSVGGCKRKPSPAEVETDLIHCALQRDRGAFVLQCVPKVRLVMSELSWQLARDRAQQAEVVRSGVITSSRPLEAGEQFRHRMEASPDPAAGPGLYFRVAGVVNPAGESKRAVREPGRFALTLEL